MARINVTKAFLPPKEAFLKYVDAMWDSAYLTNNGPHLQQLEKELMQYLDCKNLMVCNNGTIVLQMALKALKLTGQIITTPFSYVATVNAILWENCTPVFTDIDPKTFCIDADLIEKCITPTTQAILCTHVYGLPCDVEKIESIAQKHHLKVIYDGAHAFGAKLNGKALLNYGDISTCSFHATKLFHTVEGGCIIVKDDQLAHSIYLERQFGHINDDYYNVGINGKSSEMHAAMGLCVLPYVEELIRQRKDICDKYDKHLNGKVFRPVCADPRFENNYAYYPVVFKNEEILLRVKASLEQQEIYSRRYFYPSLNQLPFIENAAACPVSENISRRVLCLPLYPGLSMEDVDRIAGIITSALSR